MKALISIVVSLFILGSCTSSYALQEGSLSFNNMLEHAIKLRYETHLTNGTIRNIFTVTKNIVLRCVNSLSNDPEQWQEVKAQDTGEFSTQFRIDPKLGGKGSIWGDTIEIQIYQPHNHETSKFILSKVMAYIVMAQDKTVVLHNEEHGITIFPTIHSK